MVLALNNRAEARKLGVHAGFLSGAKHALSFVLTMAHSANIDGLGTLSLTRDLVVQFFEWFGNLSIFCARWIWAAFAPPYELREFVRQFDELGSKSLPLVAIAGAATGIVLTLSTRDSLIRFAANGRRGDQVRPARSFFCS
jgi:hypothetical protein